MILYIIKSSLCLIVLLGIYLLFLEREKMHRFNRFFLLSALFLGLSIPFFTIDTGNRRLFTEKPAEVIETISVASSEFVEEALESKQKRVQEYKAPQKQPEQIDQPKQVEAQKNEPNVSTVRVPEQRDEAVTPTPIIEPEEKETVLTAITLEEPLVSLKDILLALYGIGFLIFAGRFVAGLVSFYRKGVSNRNIEYRSVRLVLLPEPTVPHTFLNTIYVNKHQFESGELSKQILDHELTHAKEKHSLDVLFIELLRIIFWFNPVFYFYKRAIQINHEFLADESVISKTQDSVSYQKLLLDSIFPSYQTSLASTFNYSLTKKRFKMMIKESSFVATLSKKMVLVPVLASIIFIFCTKVSNEEKSFIKNGEVFVEAISLPEYVFSDTILFSKESEKDRYKNSDKWKFYNQDGELFTGEWYAYYKNDGGLFRKKNKELVYRKLILDDGRPLKRLLFGEDQGEMFTVRNEFRRDTLLETRLTRNDTLIWKTIFLPNSDLKFVQQYDRGNLGYEAYSTGYKYDQYFYKLATVYDETGNIKNQERYNDEGERIPITQKYLEQKLNEVKETYLESVSDYFDMNVRQFTQQEFDLKYSEVLLNRQRVIAFMNKVNPENNRSDEILIPRRRWAKGGWALAKPIKIGNKEFMEGRSSDEIGFLDIRLYYPLEEKGARGGFQTIHDEYGEIFSGETYTYIDQERPILYADENSGSHIVSFYENGKMVRQEGFSDDQGDYIAINKFKDDWLRSSIVLLNDTLASKMTYDSETGITSTQHIQNGKLRYEATENILAKKFTMVGLATFYNDGNILTQNLYDSDGNEIPITREYLEKTFQEYEQVYKQAFSDYMGIEAIPANKESLNIAYWKSRIANDKSYALMLKLDTTGTKIPPRPIPPNPERRLINTGY